MKYYKLSYDYENDDDYETILPFWNYGAKNLAAATDSDWKEYFINVKDRIEKRNKRLKKKNIFIVLIKFVAMSMMIIGHIYKL